MPKSRGSALPGLAVKREEADRTPHEQTPPLDAWFAEYGTTISRVLSARSENRSIIAEAILGPDDRQQVFDTQAYPYCCICSLLITAANGAHYVGTGWLAGPKTVITAGHCVYMRNQGGWASEIQVVPGRNGNAEPFGRFASRRFRSVNGWVAGARPESDYGAILLDEAMSDEIGTLGYEAMDDSALGQLLINVVGYPADKDPYGTMWAHVRSIGSVASEQLHYMNDTYGGQSGAPVIYWDEDTYAVVGIHNYGDISGNTATRITDGVLANIQAWSA